MEFKAIWFILMTLHLDDCMRSLQWQPSDPSLEDRKTKKNNRYSVGLRQELPAVY